MVKRFSRIDRSACAEARRHRHLQTQPTGHAPRRVRLGAPAKKSQEIEAHANFSDTGSDEMS
jgi:hypothetical protein